MIIPASPVTPADIADAERLIRYQKYETLYVFGSDGSCIGGYNGDVSSAEFGDDLALIRNSTCVHNHPSGNLFSPEDIIFIRDLNPAEFRVITSKKRFRVVRSGLQWPNDLVDRYGQWFSAFFKRYEAKRKSGKMTATEFTRRVLRESWLKTAKEYQAIQFTEENL